MQGQLAVVQADMVNLYWANEDLARQLAEVAHL